MNMSLLMSFFFPLGVALASSISAFVSAASLACMKQRTISAQRMAASTFLSNHHHWHGTNMTNAFERLVHHCGNGYSCMLYECHIAQKAVLSQFVGMLCLYCSCTTHQSKMLLLSAMRTTYEKSGKKIELHDTGNRH